MTCETGKSLEEGRNYGWDEGVKQDWKGQELAGAGRR